MRTEHPISFMRAAAVAVLLATLCCAGSPRAQGTGRAWALLWDNQPRQAQKAFEEALASNPGDCDARRGLILCNLYVGDDRRVVEEIEELSKADGAGPEDCLLVSWTYLRTLTTKKDEKTFRAALDRLASKKAFDPFDRRHILDRAAGFAYREGDLGSLRDLEKKLHRITAWSILGPFDNTSGSGHGKDYIASRTLSADREYVGKAGQKFTWHQPKVLGLLGELRFGVHFHRSEWITAYAGTKIGVTRPCDAVLSLGTCGSFVVELDGTRLLDEEKRSDQREFYHFAVRLEPGDHTLLVQVSSDDETPDLDAALSDPSGAPLDGVRCSPLVPADLVDRPVAFERRPLRMFEAIETRALGDSLDPGATFWRLLSLTLFDRAEEAGLCAEKAVERFPKSALVRNAAAYAFAAADDEDSFRRNMDASAALDPDFADGTIWAIGQAMTKKLFSKCDSLLTAVTDRKPNFVRARMLRLQFYQARSMIREAVELAELLRKAYPDYMSSYEFLASYYEQTNSGKAEEYRKEVWNRSTFEGSVLQRLGRAAAKEDVGETKKLLESMLVVYPDLSLLRAGLAEILVREGKREGLDMADETAELFPYSAEALLLKASIADLLSTQDPSRKAVAATFYTRALALDPGNLDTRDKLRRLQGRKPVREILPAVDLEAARSASTASMEGEGVNACVLLHESRRIAFDDGSSHVQTAYAIKVLDDKGVERFSSLSTGINPLFSDLTIIEAKTIKPDGREIEAQRLLGEVAFQNLSPGDIVELLYESSSWSPGKLNLEFWDSHEFQWDIPCLVSRYVLLASKGKAVTWKLWNAPADSVIRAVARNMEDFKYYSWTYERVPARKWEILAPPARDASPWLDVSTVRDWSEIVAWYAALSDDPARPDPRIRAKARELFGAAPDRETAIDRAYDFVCNQVAYENLDFQYSAYIPEKASDVLQSMYGDCKDKVCLMKSLLSAAGIESYFVLVTSAYDGVSPYLPSPRFSHAILAVPDSAGPRFFDPTAKGMPSGCHPTSLEEAPALVVEPGRSALVRIPTVSGNATSVHEETEVRILEDNSMRIERREIILEGDEIASLRDRLRGESADERRAYFANVLSQDLVGLRLDRIEWEGLDTPGDTLVVLYEGVIADAIIPSGGLRVVKLPWRTRMNDDLAGGVARTDRREAMVLRPIRLAETEVMRVILPAGWTIEGLPEARILTDDNGSAGFSYERRGAALTARRNVRIFGEKVPVAGYEKFKSFLESVIRQRSASLVLKEGA